MVDGTGLENRRAVKRTEGSNPSLSARLKSADHSALFLFSKNLNVSSASACTVNQGR